MSAKNAPPTGNRGIQIRIVDPKLQGYLQRYPFASGPDAEMNQQGLAAVAANTSWRPAGPEVATELLSPDEARLSAGDEAAVRRLMDAVKLGTEAQEKHLDDFGWKVKSLPRETKDVLVIGCGDGIELMFLRAVLPEARLTAMDYYDSLLPGLKNAVQVDHRIGDVNALLASLAPGYDLVFSNHTLEHLYAPDELLVVLRSLLRASGRLVSALPMCACAGTPFLEKAAALADGAKALHPLDAPFLDAGHPWKTSPSDLAATLQRAQFEDVRIFQRREHLCRPLAAARVEMESGRAAQTRSNALWLGPLRGALKSLFPRSAPASVVHGFFALERRVPFGTNKVMNRYSEEALFSCVRS